MQYLVYVANPIGILLSGTGRRSNFLVSLYVLHFLHTADAVSKAEVNKARSRRISVEHHTTLYHATHAVYTLYLSLNLAEYALDIPMAYVLVMPYLVCFDRYSGTTSPGASVGPSCI